MVDFPESPDANYNAEKSLIYAVINLPECLDVCRSIVQGKHFQAVDLGKAYDVAFEMRAAGEDVGAVPLAERLEKQDGQKEFWTNLLLGVLQDVFAYPPHAPTYARIVLERWQRRQVYYTASQLASDCGDISKEPRDLISEAVSDLEQIQQAKEVGARGPLEDVSEFLTDLDSPNVRGLMTGFCDLDDLTNGLKPCALVILAARPREGKTAKACNVILNVTKGGNWVFFASLEQSRREVIERLLAMHSRIDSERLQRKQIDDRERSEVVDSATVISNLKLMIDDTPGQTVADINASARMVQARYGLSMVVIDYLQIISPADPRAPREQQISRISRELKMMAKQLQVPVLSLAQLSRSLESRQDKRPQLSDLRESGAIEQDADVVLMLHRPKLYDDSKDETEAWCYVRKHRNGKTGDIPLRWDGQYMLFQNIAKPTQEERENFETRGTFTNW